MLIGGALTSPARSNIFFPFKFLESITGAKAIIDGGGAVGGARCNRNGNNRKQHTTAAVVQVELILIVLGNAEPTEELPKTTTLSHLRRPPRTPNPRPERPFWRLNPQLHNQQSAFRGQKS